MVLNVFLLNLSSLSSYCKKKGRKKGRKKERKKEREAKVGFFLLFWSMIFSSNEDFYFHITHFPFKFFSSLCNIL